MSRVYVPLNVAAEYLQDADVLSYTIRPGFVASLADPLSKAIAVAGRGEEYHTGMVCRDNGSIVALGMRLGAQKLKLLEDEVEALPGRIDVYRFMGHVMWSGKYPHQAIGLRQSERRLIVNEVRRYALHDHYGWAGVTLASFYFVPGLRWLTEQRPTSVEDFKRPPFCSQAIDIAFRQHARPLLNNRRSDQMLPGDVVTSPLLMRLFTLDAPVAQPQPIEWYFDQQRRGAA